MVAFFNAETFCIFVNRDTAFQLVHWSTIGFVCLCAYSLLYIICRHVSKNFVPFIFSQTNSKSFLHEQFFNMCGTLKHFHKIINFYPFEYELLIPLLDCHFVDWSSVPSRSCFLSVVILRRTQPQQNKEQQNWQ